jgi:hypothetical protein
MVDAIIVALPVSILIGLVVWALVGKRSAAQTETELKAS